VTLGCDTQLFKQATLFSGQGLCGAVITAWNWGERNICWVGKEQVDLLNLQLSNWRLI